MRTIPISIAIILLGGCITPGVFGSGAVDDCGTAADPAVALVHGIQASSVGVEFRAKGAGVEVWMEATQVDIQVWIAAGAEAWAILVVDPDEEKPTIREARIALGRYSDLATSVDLISDGPAAFTGPARSAPTGLKLTKPVPVAEGERLLLFAAASSNVMSLVFEVKWKGCGATSEPAGNVERGRVYGWHNLRAPLAIHSGLIATAGYEATLTEALPEGVVLAAAPDGAGPLNSAELRTSEGAQKLSANPSAHTHKGGTVQYRANHIGGGDSADRPLLVHFPLPLDTLDGPYRLNASAVIA